MAIGGMGGGMMVGMGGGSLPHASSGAPVSQRVVYLIARARDDTTRLGHCLAAVVLGLAAGEAARRATGAESRELSRRAG